MNIKQWIANSLVLPDAKIDEVVDANLLGIVTQQEDDNHVRKRDCISTIMRLALTCCAESPEERISMKEAVATLNKIKTVFEGRCCRKSCVVKPSSYSAVLQLMGPIL
ncbi:unnamed protein product [Prunus armeniaca]